MVKKIQNHGDVTGMGTTPIWINNPNNQFLVSVTGGRFPPSELPAWLQKPMAPIPPRKSGMPSRRNSDLVDLWNLMDLRLGCWGHSGPDFFGEILDKQLILENYPKTCRVKVFVSSCCTSVRQNVQSYRLYMHVLGGSLKIADLRLTVRVYPFLDASFFRFVSRGTSWN